MPRSDSPGTKARRLLPLVESIPADLPPRKAAFAAFSLAANALSQREHGERDPDLADADLLRACALLIASCADSTSRPRERVAASVLAPGPGLGLGSSPSDAAAAFGWLLADPSKASRAEATARTLLSAL